MKASVEKEEQIVNSEGSLARPLSARAAKSVIASSEEAISGPRPVSIALIPNTGGKKWPRSKSNGLKRFISEARGDLDIIARHPESHGAFIVDHDECDNLIMRTSSATSKKYSARTGRCQCKGHHLFYEKHRN